MRLLLNLTGISLLVIVFLTTCRLQHPGHYEYLSANQELGVRNDIDTAVAGLASNENYNDTNCVANITTQYEDNAADTDYRENLFSFISPVQEYYQTTVPQGLATGIFKNDNANNYYAYCKTVLATFLEELSIYPTEDTDTWSAPPETNRYKIEYLNSNYYADTLRELGENINSRVRSYILEINSNLQNGTILGTDQLHYSDGMAHIYNDLCTNVLKPAYIKFKYTFEMLNSLCEK